VPRLNRLS